MTEVQQKRYDWLVAKKDNLVDRLDVGAAKIEEARARGRDVSDWEEYWMELHARYERVCNEIRAMEQVQA